MLIAKHLMQIGRFRKISSGFNATYSKLKKLGKEPFVMPFWDNINKKVLESFQPMPKWDFLSNRAIKDTMFVAGDERWLKTQIDYLEKKVGPSLKSLAKEDPTGSPLLLGNIAYKTSHNTLHHLYHIYYYLTNTKVKSSTIKTVVEWGGGYGNFAKLWRRAIDDKGTYIILDTALFASIQWLYLSTVLGKSEVHLLNTKDATIQAGKINLVPIAIMKKLDIKGDLFVSTWGLSESLDEAQDYVVKKDWFSCEHLLIGFQDSTEDLEHASRLGKIAEKHGAKIIDIEFIPKNHYAFK